MTNIDEARKRLVRIQREAQDDRHAQHGLVLPDADLATVLDALDAAERERDEALAVIERAKVWNSDSHGTRHSDLRDILDTTPTDALRQVKAEAWDEGAKWAAVECGAIRDEAVAWLTPGDNPYRIEKGEQ